MPHFNSESYNFSGCEMAIVAHLGYKLQIFWFPDSLTVLAIQFKFNVSSVKFFTMLFIFILYSILFRWII